MASFTVNECKFDDCGLRFKCLTQLIEHIESTHIDFDPRLMEQKAKQLTSVPLSYILRYSNRALKENATPPQSANAIVPRPSTSVKNSSQGIETEEVEDFYSELDDSSDSWNTTEEYSPEFILRNGSRNLLNRSTSVNKSSTSALDKPFACPVPGCKKRYKNINGIRYHSKNGHKNDAKAHKNFQCFCGKSYKTSYGLKHHEMVQHNGLQMKITNSRPNQKTETSDCEFEEISRAPAKTSRQKVAAIEDHGYMKSEDGVCDLSLGVLTPASSPIKFDATQSHAYTRYLGVHASQMHHN